MNNIKIFKKFFNFEFEIIENKTVEEVSKIYFQALEEGTKKGFTPVFLVLDDILIDKFEINLDDENANDMKIVISKNLEKYKEIDPVKFFNTIKEEIIVDKLEGKDSIPKTVDYLDNIESYFSENLELTKENKNKLELSILFTDDWKLKNNVVLVKAPTENPYELLAYFDMGGFNDCPNAYEQVAICKYWYEKYKSFLAAITYDEIEFYVQNPPITLEDTKKLTIEQDLFCLDLVDQCFGSYDNISDFIYNNVQWYFWWD